MRSLPGILEQEVSKMLQSVFGNGSEIQSVKSLSGGSINTACKLILNSGRSAFLKYNLDARFPGMFAAEARGLDILHNTSTVRLPTVLGHGVAGEHSFLVLEMVEAGRPRADIFSILGRQLAAMHKVSDDHFGLDHNNYIGSLLQLNDQRKSFDDFFSEMRLFPLAKMAFDSGLMDTAQLKQIETICARINILIPDEPPALVHGDLWSGNLITGPEGGPWLIDPAVYFGHRETDIAMTRLFGGFENTFYESYNEEHPLETGWEERLDIHNLYPLLVHLNLFGSGYLPQIEQILWRYC